VPASRPVNVKAPSAPVVAVYTLLVALFVNVNVAPEPTSITLSDSIPLSSIFVLITLPSLSTLTI